MIRQQVCDIGAVLEGGTLTVDVDGRIVVHALPPEAFPVVESFLGIVAFMPHMPFTKK